MDYLALLDWRRQVSELFAELRARPADAETLAWFRGRKDQLYREHSQSPIPAERRQRFARLSYWPWGPDARIAARYTASADAAAPLPTSADDEMRFRRIGRLDFSLRGASLHLDAFWVDGYAGGLIVPFRDATGGRETYGGGRYLLDTIKSADLGSDADGGTVVLDFNYAYHPSCAFDPRWACPLAPPENWLDIEIRAGERSPPTEPNEPPEPTEPFPP